MTFAFAQPLKLLAIGGSLITSSSLWFFRPHPPLPIQTRSSTSASSRERDDNINTFDPVPKLANYTPPVSKFDALITSSPTVNNSSKDVIFTHNSKEMKLDYTTWDKIENFQLGNIMGLRSQYKEISKESIKIHLFKNPAWFSSTNEDEYESPLTLDKVEELFKGLDETKTKQLLLSLYKNRKWYRFQDQENLSHYIARIPFLQNTSDPRELKELKVKYFDDFDTLKTYVHKKVKESCKDDDKACIAHPDELTFLQADSLKYFTE